MPPRFVQCTVCVSLRSGKTVNVSESRHEQLRALAQDPDNPQKSAEATRARKLLQQVFGKEVYLVHFQSLRKKEKIQLPRWETSQIPNKLLRSQVDNCQGGRRWCAALGTVTSAWTRVAVTSEAQQLCFEGQDCAKAVLLYQHLHAVVTQTVGAYDGGADSKYWFSEGLLSHLYQVAPHSVLDRGAEPERPSTDESVWGFWEGLLTGRSTEPELRVSSHPVSHQSPIPEPSGLLSGVQDHLKAQEAPEECAGGGSVVGVQQVCRICRLRWADSDPPTNH